MLSLDDRLAEAFAKPPASDALATLLDEVVTADTAARETSESAKLRALDPATPPAAVAEARKEMEDAGFVAARMATATPLLRKLLEDRKEQEADARRAKARAAALKERDALAKELADVYPPLAEKLGDLLERIAANDAKMGLGETVEEVARNPPQNWRVNPQPWKPDLVHSVRLPKFDLSQPGTGWTYAYGSNGIMRE